MKTNLESPTSIEIATVKYIIAVGDIRSKSTTRTYRNATNLFCKMLAESGVDPKNTPIKELTEDYITAFINYVSNLAATTEQLYLQALKGFYEYVDFENLADINFSRVRNLIRQRPRHARKKLPFFPMDKIEYLINFYVNLNNLQSPIQPGEEMREMRDRAFLLTLADSGLRVHEACRLRIGEIDWNTGRGILSGTSGKREIVRFSTRSLTAINEYLNVRATLDKAANKPRQELPVFARHDKVTGKKIKHLTPTTGRNIVSERVELILGKEFVGVITPHSFRHYFVTTVLRGLGDIKLAQELARHSNIQVTQRYAHLTDKDLDKGYNKIFENKD